MLKAEFSITSPVQTLFRLRSRRVKTYDIISRRFTASRFMGGVFHDTGPGLSVLTSADNGEIFLRSLFIVETHPNAWGFFHGGSSTGIFVCGFFATAVGKL